MAYPQIDDPFLEVQGDVQSTLLSTRQLFSSYLRIRTLATSATSPELAQSRTELVANLSIVSADLADLLDSVAAVESDPYRFGLDVAEVGRRRAFVSEVGAEIEAMRRELEDATHHNSNNNNNSINQNNSQQKRKKDSIAAANGQLPAPSAFDKGIGDGYDDDQYDEDPDGYAAFENQQQQSMMREQDEQLDGVFRTVGVLRGQAEDMGRELEEQGHMLEEVDTLADRVGGKLQVGVKKVGYIIKKNEDTISSCCIAVLIMVLILLLILVIVL